MTKDPISECFAAATTELMRRPHQFKAQEIKDVNGMVMATFSYSLVLVIHLIPSAGSGTKVN